jgi:dihydroxyacetone kinase
MIELGPEEIEYGIGNHGEAGVERSYMGSAEEITERLAGEVVTELGLGPDDRVATMVNGMGATPVGELYVVNNNLHSMLQKKNVRVEQTWVGNYTTSLDMKGCSIVMMRLDDELRDLISAPAQTPGFSVGGKT